MTEYVLGFAFRGDQVTLIEKTKPDWQAGRLNGIGGKIEPTDQSPVAAMVREFAEEAGIKTSASLWTRFADMIFPDCRVYCFATILLQEPVPRTMTEERVLNYYAEDVLPSAALPNLRWLIPMALNRLRGYEERVFVIETRD